MLKRKRPEMRPPPSYASASASASASRYPPSQPQPEKAIEKFEASHAEVMRAIKKARVFDQQRLVKKIQEEKEPDKVKGKRKGKPRRKPQATGANANADGEPTGPVLNTDLIARLERELAVIKTLDMEITARVHLAHAMSRVKGLVDAPGPLPAHLQIAEVLATRSKSSRTEDTHNVTSSLYNKPFVRDAVAKAVKEMCQLIGVSDKKEPLKKKKEEKEKKEKEKKEKKEKKKTEDDSDGDGDEGGINYNGDDDDEIERELAKFDAMLGGDDKGSDDDDDNDEAEESDGDGDAENEDAEIAKLRAKYKRALAKGLIADDARDDYSGEEDGEDDFDGFSGGDSDEDDDDESEEDESEEEEEEEQYSSESEVEKRPRKRAAAPVAAGVSNFLPSLMGGFMAGDAGDNSDGYGSDDAQRDERAAAKMLGVVRKNRRGQRARQAIWEKKYKEDAKHVIKEKLDPKPVAEKWDAKRGAVDASDQPRWMRRKLAAGGRAPYTSSSSASAKPAVPKKKENENANKQVTGTLHPSWEAARKAKEAAQTAEYKGTKIVFD